MSKKELLNEAQIRRFMTLANLEPLVKNVVSHTKTLNEMNMPTVPPAMQKMEADPTPEVMGGEMDMPEPAADEPASDEGGSDQEMLGDLLEDIVAVFKERGLDVNLESDSGSDEEPADEEPADEEPADEEPADEEPADEKEMEEGKHKKAKKKEEEEEEEMEEGVALSEDSLVEAVLARVTARLVQEAKKSKMTPKQKAALKKKEMEAKKKKLAEATSAEGGGPLLKQGKNKYDVYKGHADMAYAKGKEGKGGHEMETVSAKAEHSVTHGGKNLATLGGNKKKT